MLDVLFVYSMLWKVDKYVKKIIDKLEKNNKILYNIDRKIKWTESYLW